MLRRDRGKVRWLRVPVTDDEYKRLKHAAVDAGKSMADVILEHLRHPMPGILPQAQEGEGSVQQG